MAGIKLMAKVRATARGYYGGAVREPGDTFAVADGATASWFEPVGGVAEPVADPVDPVVDPAAPEPKRKGRAKPETVQAPVAAPFAEPVRVANEVNEITGQTEPDWINPASDI